MENEYIIYSLLIINMPYFLWNLKDLKGVKFYYIYFEKKALNNFIHFLNIKNGL